LKRTLISIALASMLLPSTGQSAEPLPEFQVSYAAGTTDATGQRMGGTETRNLAVHGGMLFAANGYWEDRPGLFGGTPGAQILVLDRAGGQWRVDHEFEERTPNGHQRHLAVSALREVIFRTDLRGTPLAAPVPKLLASTFWPHQRLTRRGRSLRGPTPSSQW